METVKHILPFLKENKWHYIFGITVLLIIDGLQLVTPKLIGNMTDDLLNHTATPQVLIKYILYIMLIAVGVAIGRYFWRILIIGSSRRLEAWLRDKLFTHLETLPASFFNTHKTGDMMALATNDINAVRMAFGHGIVMVTDAIFLTVMTVGIMSIQLDWKLTFLAALPLPIIALSVSALGIRIKNRFRKVQEAFGSLTDKTQESFSGIRIVKSFVQEESELTSFKSFNEDNYQANMSLVRIWSLMHPLVTLISAMSLVLALTFGSRLVIDGTLTLGEFVAFITYLSKLTWPMLAIGWLVNMVQRGLVSLGRINEILDVPMAYAEDEHLHNKTYERPMNQAAEDFTIAFEDVSFTYPTATYPALEKINFSIENGKTLAIVGRTGSGKTTLTSLLLRVYDGYSGKITIGGINLLDYPVSQIRQMIGFVPQDNFLFSKTVKENLLFSGTQASDDKVITFAEIAQLHREISEFPKAYDTLLGEKGVNLSGGQKQRLSIARALIKEPPILIFDDALSAVDTKTEARLLEGLKEKTSGKTTLLIAHRISTVKHADWIIVLDEGRVAESGTHESLINQNGIYADMHKKQMLEEQMREQA